MSLELANYEAKAREAAKLFWRTREAASNKQAKAGTQDKGERSSVTAGKHMDGFQDIFRSLVEANGLESAEICVKRKVLTLPGFFRPAKIVGHARNARWRLDRSDGIQVSGSPIYRREL